MGLSIKRTAAILFWSHLIPMVFLTGLFYLLYDYTPDEYATSTSWYDYLATAIFMMWFICPLIYFIQFNFTKYTYKRSLWIYTTVMNTIGGSLAVASMIALMSVIPVCIAVFYLGSAWFGYLAVNKV